MAKEELDIIHELDVLVDAPTVINQLKAIFMAEDGKTIKAY
jgi:hypothetical protein